MAARLPIHVWIGALRRQVEAAGGFVVVVAKGDPDAGSVLLLLRGRGGRITAVTGVNTGAATRSWQKIYEADEDTAGAIDELCKKHRRYDPDLWIVELDVDDAARFLDGEILES